MQRASRRASASGVGFFFAIMAPRTRSCSGAGRQSTPLRVDPGTLWHRRRLDKRDALPALLSTWTLHRQFVLRVERERGERISRTRCAAREGRRRPAACGRAQGNGCVAGRGAARRHIKLWREQLAIRDGRLAAGPRNRRGALGGCGLRESERTHNHNQAHGTDAPRCRWLSFQDVSAIRGRPRNAYTRI